MTLLGPDSRIAASHLVVRQEDEDEYVVGDPGTGTFVAVPEIGARLVELFKAGHTVEEAATAVEEETGEVIDALDFAEVLVEAGLLDRRTAAAAPPKGVRYWSVSRIPARYVRPLFGRAAWTVYAACLVLSIAMLAAQPGLLPTYEDTFFLPDVLLSIIVTNIVVIGLAFVHELWHGLAGVAVGVPSRLRIERRGIFPALETDLSGLWALPPIRRYGPFLAGMAVDSVLLFLALAPRFAWSHGWIELPPLLVRFLAVVVFGQLLKLIFQLLAYLRTDMYLVLATAMGCRNLHQVTRLSLKRLIRRLTPDERVILRDAHARDLQVSRWYRLLYLAGITWMCWFAYFYLWPSAKVVFGWMGGVLRGAPPGSYGWWEAIVLGLFAAVNLFLPLAVIVRNRREARRALA
jgi:putative peptide zinc metalloprotease protein